MFFSKQSVDIKLLLNEPIGEYKFVYEQVHKKCSDLSKKLV